MLLGVLQYSILVASTRTYVREKLCIGFNDRWRPSGGKFWKLDCKRWEGWHLVYEPIGCYFICVGNNFNIKAISHKIWKVFWYIILLLYAPIDVQELQNKFFVMPTSCCHLKATQGEFIDHFLRKQFQFFKSNSILQKIFNQCQSEI